MVDKDDFCPMCNYKLRFRYEGWVCKNGKCKLYHKLGTGWVKYDKQSMLQKKNNINSLFRKSSSRWTIQQDLARLKQNVMARDKYCCQKCGCKWDLVVHHIIPVSEDWNMALEKDNLVTLCVDCHNLIHSCDKARFKS